MLKGNGVALVTPFLEDGKLDMLSFEKLLGHVGQPNGADFVVVGGTTGESATISWEEKGKLVQATRMHKALEGKKIVLGLGGNDTAALLDEINTTDFNGVAAILSVTPYYNKPTQAGLVAHYRALASACPVPVLLYNVPSRTGVNLSIEAVHALAEHPNICGLKEADTNLIALRGKALSASLGMMNGDEAGLGVGFSILGGDDASIPAMVEAGCVGVIGVMGNALPVEMGNVVRAALAGEYHLAQELQKPLLELDTLLYVEGNPGGIKAALEALGICTRAVRLPLVEPSQELRQLVSQQLELLGKIK
jgi:4-hydroxy-tetrahydrodipicolinate synthase